MSWLTSIFLIQEDEGDENTGKDTKLVFMAGYNGYNGYRGSRSGGGGSGILEIITRHLFDDSCIIAVE